MSRLNRGAVFLTLWVLSAISLPGQQPRRLIILKVDGLNEDLLEQAMRGQDPNTGKSQLPWITRIFAENGTIYQNFYTRGISLSAPSWSMLDTGRHTVIRGNVEYDRYTGQVYDYLNFFPLYIGYARQRQADMPGVEVLDRAGIPLLIDRYRYQQVYQSFQLFQRGVRWTTLESALKRRLSSKVIFSMLEGATPSYDSLLADQTKAELDASIKGPDALYIDFYTGDVDHEGHATSDPAALLIQLREVDRLAGHIWTGIQNSPYATNTVFVMVSDHGMNNVPGIVSQTFSLPDVLNSPEGGAHHVVTNREQLSDFKLMGLNPLVHRVISPSTASFYLKGEADHYPTAWLDIDGNERAALHLRNSDLNKIHILLLQLSRSDLDAATRKAAAKCLSETIDQHRAAWSAMATDLDEEMQALAGQIAERKPIVAAQPKRWKKPQMANGDHQRAWRLRAVFDDWQEELAAYTSYSKHLKALLAFEPDPLRPLKVRISELIPEMSLGDGNSPAEIMHYVTGPSACGLRVGSDGRIDEELSFRHIDYLSLFAQQRARNVPQPELSLKPIDFLAMRLPDREGSHVYWLYGSSDSQIVVLSAPDGRITIQPIRNLKQHGNEVDWDNAEWRPGLPLELLQDPAIDIAPTARADWLSRPHTEAEWLLAVHKSKYSNGVIGITEELSPVGRMSPARRVSALFCFAMSAAAANLYRPMFTSSPPITGISTFAFQTRAETTAASFESQLILFG